MRNTITSIFIILLANCVARGAEPSRESGENWPHWRGPNANGTSSTANPPTTWDSKTHLRWQVEIPGRGSSSPIVWGDRVFVTTAVKTDKLARAEDLPKLDSRFETKTEPPTHFYQFIVYCLERSSGKILWKDLASERVPHEGHHETHSYAAGSPTTDGKNLYVSFGSFGTFCYTLEGNKIWERDFGRLHSRLGWGEAVTPVVHGDNLLINWDQEADSKLICLDTATGKTRWQTDRPEKTTWTTPLVVEHASKIQVILNGTNRVRSYDLANGKEIWRCAGMTVNAIPSPVRSKNSVFVMSGYRGSMAVSIDLDSVGEVTSGVQWKHDKGTPYVPSPLLVDDKLYFTQANQTLLTILDSKSGKAVLDRERLPAITSCYASPVAASGRIYFVGRDGTTLVIKQSDRLEVLATNRLNDPIDATPALAGKQLFIRSHSRVYCVEE